MTIDFFLAAILVLFIQYAVVYMFIRMGSRWSQSRSVVFYATAAVVGTVGFSLIFALFKWHFGFTFVSPDFEIARNCLGLLTFMMISKIYGLMPVEFMVRHLPY